MSFDEVALRYNTDKSSAGHGYMDIYERALTGRTVRRVLEVGVWQGESLRMWSELFPAAHIVGIDNDADRPGHHAGSPDITVITADATNARQMNALGGLFGPFDLIVDDGSHVIADVRVAYELLVRFLAPGGVYVIEDLEYPVEVAKLGRKLVPPQVRYEIGACTRATGEGPCLIVKGDQR